MCRELTKKHETGFSSDLETLLTQAREQKTLGECVLVIRGALREDLERTRQESWESMSVPEHVAYYENMGLDRKEAMKRAAQDRGASKRDIYQEIMRK